MPNQKGQNHKNGCSSNHGLMVTDPNFHDGFVAATRRWSKFLNKLIFFNLFQLTTNITTGLHQMIQYVWAYDYDTCLQVVNQMVSSGGSFALLAEFMPGVKVLIQVAKQMGVYIERPASQ